MFWPEVIVAIALIVFLFVICNWAVGVFAERDIYIALDHSRVLQRKRRMNHVIQDMAEL